MDIGSNSLGKATFPIRAAFDVTVPLAFNTDSENAVQGQKATARKGTNPIDPASEILALNIVVKTKA
jgi:hypothetical protein